MKPVVVVYCEGNDSKFAVFAKENGQIRLLRAISVDVFRPNKPMENLDRLAVLDSSSELSIDAIDNTAMPSSGEAPSIIESIVSNEFRGIKLHKSLFIPVLTEPSIFYSTKNKKTLDSHGVTSEIVADTETPKSKKKSGNAEANRTEMADGGSIYSYLSADVPCFKMINSIARFNDKKFYKIESVKSAEISLAYYVAKKKKFFPDDYSLVVYIGKEYSKLIFLHGRKLKHIGSTLDVGTSNLHTYDVYFSKILLEMENGGIPNLDNVVVCGEDDSENLILSFYGTFPEANVSRLEFDGIDFTGVPEDTRVKISSYSVTIAAVHEYFEELSKEHIGINLLPKYIIEEQKIFQFAWHGYLMIPLLFFAAIYITLQILQYNSEISTLNQDIAMQSNLKQQNLALLSQIEGLDKKVNTFDQTQTILDSVTVGTEVWSNFLERVSDFCSKNRSLWARNIIIESSGEIVLEGHALNKFILTDFATHMGNATLRKITYDPISTEDAYSFIIGLKTKGIIRTAKK
ncbi:MAG: hypothetical protein KF721_03940 [Ignavibacteriaceae bacterium]|nr:hypothetical protein [Ignavibacteriaceae bacterium]